MECPSCPICDKPMRRVVYDKNGKVYCRCLICAWTEETKELAPPFYDNNEYGKMK